MAKQLVRRSAFLTTLSVYSRMNAVVKEAKKMLLVRIKQLRYVEA